MELKMRLCVVLFSLSLCLVLMGHVRTQEEADDMEMDVEDAIDDIQEEDIEEEEQQSPTPPPVPTVRALSAQTAADSTHWSSCLNGQTCSSLILLNCHSYADQGLVVGMGILSKSNIR